MSDDKKEGNTLLLGDAQMATRVLAMLIHTMGRPLVFPEEMLDSVAGMGLIIKNMGPGVLVAYVTTREEAEAVADANRTDIPDFPKTDKSKWN